MNEINMSIWTLSPVQSVENPIMSKKIWRFLHRLSAMRWKHLKEGAELNWSIYPIVAAAIDLALQPSRLIIKHKPYAYYIIPKVAWN